MTAPRASASRPDSHGGFLHRPQPVWARRVLFQVHLWAGLLAGLYIAVVSLTGAALVFRIDIQRWQYPHLFTAGAGTPLDAAAILERVQQAFPGDRVSGVDAPTAARPTYLAYVVTPDRFLTLFVEPVSGTVLGELPQRTVIRTMQDLHFDLLGGRTGRTLNGAGAGVLLVLCATGLVIWWPGMARWRRGFVVDLRRSWKRVIWDIHGAAGICAAAFLAIWAITGIHFAFPARFRAAVNAVAPLTAAATPRSIPSTALKAGTEGSTEPASTWRPLIDTAREQVPDQHVARVVVPSDPRAAFLVMFSPARPTPPGATLTSVYLDQYSGTVVAVRRPAERSLGDAVVDWLTPLHIGSFGGRLVQAVWVLFALAPPILFATGFTMWWTRTVRQPWF